jgi:hypothetical protein
MGRNRVEGQKKIFRILPAHLEKIETIAATNNTSVTQVVNDVINRGLMTMLRTPAEEGAVINGAAIIIFR